MAAGSWTRRSDSVASRLHAWTIATSADQAGPCASGGRGSRVLVPAAAEEPAALARASSRAACATRGSSSLCGVGAAKKGLVTKKDARRHRARTARVREDTPGLVGTEGDDRPPSQFVCSPTC